jgi:hypothetical protein
VSFINNTKTVFLTVSFPLLNIMGSYKSFALTCIVSKLSLSYSLNCNTGIKIVPRMEDERENVSEILKKQNEQVTNILETK